MPSLSRKKFFIFLWGITILGFFLRLFVSLELKSSDPAVTTPAAITDMATYIKISDEILSGKFPPTFYYQPFYYSFFLPLARFFGKELGLILFQSLLGAGIIFLAGKNTLLLCGRKWGALSAACLCCFSAILIYFTPYALLELLQGFLVLLTFDLFFTAYRRHSLRCYLLAGLCWGASISTRGNTLLFLPLFLLFLLFREGDGIRNFFRKKRFYFSLLLLTGGMFLVQLPYITYNSWKLKKISGPSTAGPTVLALGNNKESAPAGLEVPYPPSFHALMRQETCPGGVIAGILQWAKEEPLAFLELKLKQFFLFWDATDHPNNISMEYNGNKSPLMRNLHFLPTSILLLFALAGFFSALRRKTFFRKKGELLLWGMLLIYAFSVALFYILARFRLPALPLAAMAGGIYLGQLIRKQEKGVFFRNLLYLGCGVFFVFLLYPLYLLTYEPFVMEYCRPCGVRNKVLPEDVPGMGEGGKRPWEMLLDSSSPLQGSYRALPLKEGHIFVKKFLVSPGNPLPEKEHGTLIIPFSASLPSSLLLEHDGGKEFVEISPPLKYVRINHIPLTSRSLPDGKESIGVKFRVSSISGDPAIFLDAARDYGRSLIGSDAASTPEAAGMEIVLRLLLPHREK